MRYIQIRSPGLHLTLGLFAAMALNTVACGGQSEPLPDGEMLAKDAQYMASVLEKNPNGQWFVHLNLADDRQYQALQRRLAMSGNTPENSPELFAHIQKDRDKALKDQEAPRGGIAKASSAFTGPAWCGHVLPTKEATAPGVSYFTSNPQVSCFGGAEYVYADNSAFSSTQDETSMTYLAYGSDEQYAGGIDFTNVSVDSNILAGSLENKLYTDSYVIAYDTATGYSQYTYTAVRTTAGASVASATDLSPMGPPLPSTPVECLTNVHPRDIIDDPSTATDNGITRVGLERGIVYGNLDLDYATVDANYNPVWVTAQSILGVAGVNKTASLGATPKKWMAQTTSFSANEPMNFVWAVPAGTYNTSRLYIPLRGRFDASKAFGPMGSNCKIVSYVQPSTIATLSLTEVGGWCPGGNTPGSPAGQTNITAGLPTPNGTQTSAWLNLLGNFGPDCVGYQKKTRLQIQISAKIKCDGHATAVDKTCFQTVQSLDFKNSCFAEGTEITRQDGSRVEVQNIQIGDKVIANSRGQVLSVVSFARGAERHPLVNLFDADGHDLFLTEKHPVVTLNKGIVFADEVRQGDQVITESGSSLIVATNRVHYDREVFNLSLGTPEELATLRNEDRTMFANGILVGDGAMQTEMELKSELPQGDIKSRLSAAWHRDYDNDVARRVR